MSDIWATHLAKALIPQLEAEALAIQRSTKLVERDTDNSSKAIGSLYATIGRLNAIILRLRNLK